MGRFVRIVAIAPSPGELAERKAEEAARKEPRRALVGSTPIRHGIAAVPGSVTPPPPVKPGRSAVAEAVWKAREIKAVAKARERRLAALARKTAVSSKQCDAYECDAHERPFPEDALAHRLPASARTRQR